MTIRFDGKEYASVEAMPPDVREVYQEFLQDPDLAQMLDMESSTPAGALQSGSGTLPRAWGGGFAGAPGIPPHP